MDADPSGTASAYGSTDGGTAGRPPGLDRGEDQRSSVPERRSARLLGLLWLTGGILAAIWAVTAVGASGWRPGVLGVGVFAIGLGSALSWLGRSSLPLWLAVVLTLLGSVAICLILAWSGADRTGAPAVLFVYVSIYACVALDRLRWIVLGLSILAHAGTLYLAGAGSALVEVPIIWGAAVVAGLIIGRAVESTRSAAAERERLLEQLRAADAAKTAFLRAAGHDLSTPAALVAGLAETAAVRGEQLPAEERNELLERIAANARRLHGDLSDLLHLGELADGRIEPERHATDLRAVIDGAISRADLEGEVIVGTLETDTAVVDAAKVEHAIANLLTNAAKYGGDDGIEVSVTRSPDHVIVHVDDHGPGVPEDRLETMFEPFMRGREGDIERGSGVGLSIVREFARIHGGDSWAQRRDGGGLRVSFSLSAVPPSNGEAVDGRGPTAPTG